MDWVQRIEMWKPQTMNHLQGLAKNGWYMHKPWFNKGYITTVDTCWHTTKKTHRKKLQILVTEGSLSDQDQPDAGGALVMALSHPTLPTQRIAMSSALATNPMTVGQVESIPVMRVWVKSWIPARILEIVGTNHPVHRVADHI